MAEHEQDKDVSRRYRELGHDEPPPALDAKIRAEARSAVEMIAAPLVPPTGRRRWYFPVAAAAVIMLAVAVTSQVEREQPEVASMTGAKEASKNEIAPEAKPAERRMQTQDRPAARLDAPKATPEKPASPPQFTPEPGARAKKQTEAAGSPAQPQLKDALARREIEMPRFDERQRDQASASAPEASAESKLRKAQPSVQEAPVARAPSPSANLEARGAGVVGALAFQEAPEPWLERIAKLRAEGKHDEADKALAEFRKRYPDYKIPPAILEKVERKPESGR